MRDRGLPLGYFHESPWLSKHYACIHGAEPRLLDPPFSEELTIYPIPMSLVEAHQDSFWDVGVRRFSYKLVRYQMLSEGIRLHGDGVTTTRVSQHAFESERTEVTTELAELTR